MAVLNRAQILGAEDLKTQLVPVPEWGGDVIVSTMTAKMRDEYEDSLTTVTADGKVENKLENIRAKLIAAVVVDEEGNQIFTPDDIELLGKKSVKAMDRVFTVAGELNALSNNDVEELAKN